MTEPSPAVPEPRAGAKVEFSTFNDALTLLGQQTMAWVTVSFLCLSVMMSVMAVLMVPLFLSGGGLAPLDDKFAEPGTLWWWIQTFAFIPLITWVSTGGTRIALAQLRGEYVRPEELFKLDRAFSRVLGYTLIVSMATIPITLLNEWVSFAAAYFVGARLMFTVPLIIDKDLAPMDAMRGSWHALRGQWLPAFAFIIVSSAAAMSGILFLCIGMLVTLPLAYLPLAALYRRYFPYSPPSAVSPDLTDSDFRTF